MNRKGKRPAAQMRAKPAARKTKPKAATRRKAGPNGHLTRKGARLSQAHASQGASSRPNVVAGHADARNSQPRHTVNLSEPIAALCSRRPSLGQFDVRLEYRLNRGEIWTGADNAQYAEKPRPVVIINMHTLTCWSP